MPSPDPSTTEWVPLWNLGLAGGGGGGGGGPHAPTHALGSSDPVALDAVQIVSGVLVRARLPAQVAYVDATNLFTGRVDFAGYVTFSGENGSALSPTIQGNFPTLNFLDAGQPAASKYARLLYESGNLYAQGINEAYNAPVTFASMGASGFVVGDGTLPIYANGGPLTNLNASNLASGIAAPARLGSGTANSSTFLRGDGVWAVPPTGSGSGIPAGLIAIFQSACPAGWTRVAALDGRFPLGAAAYGASGGNWNHGHSASGSVSPSGAHDHAFASDTTAVGDHSHDYSGQTAQTPSDYIRADQEDGVSASGQYHSHAYGGTTNPAGGHVHSVSGRTDSPGDHSHGVSVSVADGETVPPYLEVVYCRKD